MTYLRKVENGLAGEICMGNVAILRTWRIGEIFKIGNGVGDGVEAISEIIVVGVFLKQLNETLPTHDLFLIAKPIGQLVGKISGLI